MASTAADNAQIKKPTKGDAGESDSVTDQEALIQTQTKLGQAKKEEGKGDPIDKKSEEKDKKDEEPPNNISFKNILFVIIAILACWFGYAAVTDDNSPLEDKTYLQTPEEIFREELPKLKWEFYKEPKRTIRILNYTISKTFFEEDPAGPGVILLIATDGKAEKAIQAWNQLAKLLSQIFEEPESDRFNCKELGTNVPKAKLQLSRNIERSTRNKRSVVIENVDHLQPDVVATLQPYFDEENAPIKRVVYLLTTVTNKVLQLEENGKNIREFAMSHFDEMWASYPEDYRDAMYSRMLDCVLLI